MDVTLPPYGHLVVIERRLRWIVDDETLRDLRNGSGQGGHQVFRGSHVVRVQAWKRRRRDSLNGDAAFAQRGAGIEIGVAGVPSVGIGEDEFAAGLERVLALRPADGVRERPQRAIRSTC